MRPVQDQGHPGQRPGLLYPLPTPPLPLVACLATIRVQGCRWPRATDPNWCFVVHVHKHLYTHPHTGPSPAGGGATGHAGHPERGAMAHKQRGRAAKRGGPAHAARTAADSPWPRQTASALPDGPAPP